MPEAVQSRIKQINAPLANPGVCIVCGSSRTDDRNYIDFGKQLEWFGAVYFCTECISETLDVMDFVKSSTMESTVTELYQEKANVMNLRDQIGALESVLKFYIDRGPSNGTVDDIVSGVTAYMETMGVLASHSGFSKRTEPKTDSSNDVEGSSDIFDTPNDDDVGF